MSRPNIKTALTAVFAVIALLVVGFAAFAIHSLGSINDNFETMANDVLPGVEVAKEVDTALADLRAAYRDHVLAVDDATEAAAVVSISRERERVEANLKKYEAMSTGDTERQLLSGIREAITGYTAAGDKMVAFSANQDDDNAKRVLETDMKPLSTKAAALSDQIVAFNLDFAKTTDMDNDATYQATIEITLAAIGLVVAVLAASIWFAITGIARPIQNITVSMRKLADGDSTAVIPYAGRADEIGAMAAALEVFRANAVANRTLEQDAVSQRQVLDDQRHRSAEAERTKSQAMTQATTGLADGLKRLAGGDLRFQLADPFTAEFEALRTDFNATVSQLAQTLSAIAIATSAIDSGSREISEGSNDLSKRTEQQAASLEETAAALDQITANVSNSSKRADEARTVAAEANASATRSGSVVANAVDAMQRIEQSSNQISNIIVVIDEIAFQTNLLALNAGVEAARAGDAGRGFAVVAQEVRELAQRSAKAAKEIKELIRNSSAEVQSGVKFVSETGKALKTIEGFIVTVNQHMESIATSSREQSLGLAEVNTAVNHMDQMTQQNAAMVEESTAATVGLASEASRLRDLIGQFQLQEAQAAGSVVARRSVGPSQAMTRPQQAMRPRTQGNAALKVEEWSEF